MNDREKIQAVINTMAEIMIPATFNNLNRMLGMYQTLIEVRDGKPDEKEVTEDG